MAGMCAYGIEPCGINFVASYMGFGCQWPHSCSLFGTRLLRAHWSKGWDGAPLWYGSWFPLGCMRIGGQGVQCTGMIGWTTSAVDVVRYCARDGNRLVGGTIRVCTCQIVSLSSKSKFKLRVERLLFVFALERFQWGSNLLPLIFESRDVGLNNNSSCARRQDWFRNVRFGMGLHTCTSFFRSKIL